ncbi:hypothetical protein FRC12_021216 [Ceratobasidium sp. 428]|nr:hypothetical protein FRC12_021216 [Ceratobasidium sp. 428]
MSDQTCEDGIAQAGRPWDGAMKCLSTDPEKREQLYATLALGPILKSQALKEISKQADRWRHEIGQGDH